MAEEERKQMIARQKIDFVSKVPSEPDVNHPDAIHIVIKLPCGERLDRRFLKTHSLEVNTLFLWGFWLRITFRFFLGNILFCILSSEIAGIF